MESVFRFKQFVVKQEKAAMKVNTDSILLSAWVRTKGHKRILDIGTGTGLIALMLAQRTKEALIDGVEVERFAFEETMENFANSKWTERLQAFHTPVQDFEPDLRYDLIISNPPFFTGGTLSENQSRNSVRHTLKLPNNELLGSVRKLLNDKGLFVVILPYIEALRFLEMARKFGFCLHRKAEVHARTGSDVNRLLLEFGRFDCVEEPAETIIIYADDHSQKYSETYKQLTKDFYL